MSDNRISDEELVAFLDGQLPPDRATEVREQAWVDPDAMKRMSELALDRAALKRTLDGLVVAAPVPVAAQRQRLRLRPFLQATALGAAVVAGVVGYRALGPAEMSWQDYAAAYHALYVTETLATVQRSAPEIEAELHRISAALNKPIPADVLRQPGLEFKRAQILGFEGAPLIQLAFLADGTTPVALCIIAGGAQTGEAMRATNLAGVPGVGWSAGGYQYLLLARLNPDRMQQLAREFRALL